MASNKLLITAAVLTAIQAGVQMVVSSLALMQYFCVIDFLQELPLLLYIRILYYHNPVPCGIRITIGHAIDGIPDQAFVLLINEPLTTFRTFIINCTSLGLSVFWIIASAMLMSSASNNDNRRPTRWPWVLTTICISTLDLVAVVIFANDSFHTRTLSDVMDYIGGTLSGVGNTQLDTSLAAWVMVIVYSRFVVIFFINILLIVLVAIKKQKTRKEENNNVEAQPLPIPIQPPPREPTPQPTPQPSQPIPPPPIPQPVPVPEPPEQPRVQEQPVQRTIEPLQTAPLTVISERDSNFSSKDTETSSVREEVHRIPRAGFNYAFRRMKSLLFAKPATPLPRRTSITNSLDSSPDRSPRDLRMEIDKKRTVNFPENLLSLPQRLENMIAEQQRRLDRAVIDTTGRHSPPRVSQSLPQLNETSEDSTSILTRGRRGTAVELQGQLPWSYIPASSHRMRDQLPPDEDLPPVPLPDYNAIPSFRKASVHRAASSLSSLTHKKDYTSQPPRNKSPMSPPSDVLY